jgi:RNA polymerase sigma-70 factor (ECF subfamily)
MDADASPPADLVSHAAFVRRLAFHLLRRDADADDAAQETLARAIERPPRGGDGLKAWLAAVLRNVVSGGRRADVRRRRREEVAARPEGESGPDAAAGNAQILRVVADAVASLDAPHREVVMLRHYEGLPPREIASRLGVPVETVKSRLRRAHQRLRERLDERRGGNVEGWRSALAGFAGLDLLEKTALPVGGGIAVGTATKVGIGVAAALAIGVGTWRLSASGAPDAVDAEEPPHAGARGTEAGATPTLATRPFPAAPARVPAPAGPAATAARESAAVVRDPATGEVGLLDVEATNRAMTAPDVLEVVLLGKRPGDALEVALDLDPNVGSPPDLAQRIPSRTFPVPADGVVRFDGVSPAFYRVRVRGPGDLSRAWTLPVPMRPEGNHRQVVTLGSASIAGRAYERTGEPARGRSVVLSVAGMWTQMGSPLSAWTKTDADGRYRFDAVHSGHYGVSLQFDPFPGGGMDARIRRVLLAPSQALALDLGSDVPEPVWSGSVRLRSGTPVRGPRASVHLQGREPAVAIVGPDGRFSQRLTPDTYRATIPFPGRLSSYVFEVAIGDRDVATDLVVDGVRVEGTLLDAATSKPFPLANWNHVPLVRIAAVGSEARDGDQVRPDASGAFGFDGILPGRYRVFVTVPKVIPGTGTEAVVDVGEDRDVRGVALEVRPR